MLKEQCNKIIEDLNSEKKVREDLEIDTFKAIEDTHVVFANQLKEESDEKAENYILLSQRIDDKMNQVAADIGTESKNRDSNQTEASRSINDHLSEIQGMVISQRKNR